MNLPGALVPAANGLPSGREAVGQGTSVMPDSGRAWFARVMATGFLTELTPGVTVGMGLDIKAGEAAAGVLGMSYFCSWSK